MFFGGVGPKSTDDELQAEGRQHPFFRGCPERLTAADAGADTRSATTAKRAARRHEDQRDQRDPRDPDPDAGGEAGEDARTPPAGRLSGRVQVVGRRLADGQLRAGSRHRAGPRARRRGGLVAVLVEQRLGCNDARSRSPISGLNSALSSSVRPMAILRSSRIIRPTSAATLGSRSGPKTIRAITNSRDLAPAQVVEHNPSGPAPAVGSGPNRSQRSQPVDRSPRAAAAHVVGRCVPLVDPAPAPPARGATPIAAAAAFEWWLWARRV